MKRFKYTLMIAMPVAILSTGIRQGWGFNDLAFGVLAMLIAAVVAGNVLEWLVWGGDRKEAKENET